jgi:hypothetical protein
VKLTIAPGTCPGGLVAVVFDENGTELQRAMLGSMQLVEAAAGAHAEQVRKEGGSVCIYDGDTGRPCVILTPGSVIVLEAPS